MRVENILHNSIYSMTLFALLAVLGVVVRKFFTVYLQIELLGLEGLFSGIIALLSVAEMGVSSVVSYGLYKELSNHNEKEINILMNIYRYIYLIIGIFIFLVAIVLFFFLPWIVHDDSISWRYIQLVYVIQISVVLSSYFLAYRRTLFTADQKDYICMRIDIICSLLKNVMFLFSIIILQSYIVYAVSGLAFNIVANLIISYKVKKSYPFLQSIKVSIQDMRDRHFFVDIKNFLIHKLSYVVYGGTDAIIVSSMLGLHISGLLANYALIQAGVSQLIYKSMQGIIPSIGNLVHTSELQKSYKIYRMLDLFYFFIGGCICCIYMITLQPFITLIFGHEFLLSDSYAIAVACNGFLNIQFENAWNFRAVYGSYENDRIYMVMSAVVNIVLSIVLVNYFGIVGVIIGTIVGFLFIGYGRVQFVFRTIFKKKMKRYLLAHIIGSVIVFFEIVLIMKIINEIPFPQTYFALLCKAGIAVLLMMMMQCIIFYRTSEFKDIINYMQNIKMIIENKLKKI